MPFSQNMWTMGREREGNKWGKYGEKYREKRKAK